MSGAGDKAGETYDIVLSHAPEDAATAGEIARFLQAEGLRVFPVEPEPVDVWGKATDSVLRDMFPAKTSVAMLLLSSAYSASVKCKRELEVFSDQAAETPEALRLLLPVRLDDTALPTPLAGVACMEFNQATAQDLAVLTRHRIEEFHAHGRDILAALTDDELVLRVARSRDVPAFEVLYERLYPVIREFAAAWSRGTGWIADEVAADAMVLLWENAGRFDPANGALKSWLHRMAHLAAIEHWRRASRHQDAACVDVDDVETRQVAEPTVSNSHEAAVAEQTSAALSNAVDSLSPPERRIIDRHLAGDSFSMISQLLEVPVSSVHITYHRAIEKLRRAVVVRSRGDETDR